MLKIKPYRQKPGMCGPASLKMALEYFGVEKSEKELGRLTHCDPKKGAAAENIILTAKKLGFNGFIKDNANFGNIKKYLSKNIPVIVDWFSENEGHYSVAIGIDKKNIYLQDPEVGRIKKIKLEEFKKIWFDFSGSFIKSQKDLILRRIIVITKQ